MKITPELVRQFEDDQKSHGTETAIYNVLWLSASVQLKDIGCMHIRTSTRDDAIFDDNCRRVGITHVLDEETTGERLSRMWGG